MQYKSSTHSIRVGLAKTKLAANAEEIRTGRKKSHWNWYVLPQLEGLGRSTMCKRYDVRDMGEVQAYLADATLRGRLVEISRALLV